MANPAPRLSLRQILATVFYLLLAPAIILSLAGDPRWPEGWIFILWLELFSLITLVYLYRKDPALLQERFKKPGTANQKGWDRYVIYLIMMTYWSWLAVMPLDARRFHWTTWFPLSLKILGFLILLFSSFFLYRAFTDNPFLSPLVRIQSEREHRVVSTGVYGFVRHPMYLGAIFLFLGAPLLLGSKYGLLLGVLMSLLLAARILGEEKMLVEELPGYAEYREKVKYRLMPFVW